jgi:nucleoside-diphosphate-sugar epimerase
MKIAFLGANSHIAKGLINNFCNKSSAYVFLFTRNPDKTQEFLNPLGNTQSCVIENGYNNFNKIKYDAIINCVGAGTPNKLQNDFSKWFTITEKYDNMILDYLQENSETLYFNFSSGAVYGKNGSAPFEASSQNCIPVNSIPPEDYYSIVNLNSEAKHRAFKNLKIVDLRIFSYFSRFADLTSGYFITELLDCVKNNKTFYTNDVNIVRDYIHPDDLFSLISKCMKVENINTAFDAVSAKSVDKLQILEYFSKAYNLEYEVKGSLSLSSPNGEKNIYCSNFNKASEIGYEPEYCSMKTIELESECILKSKS